jgi:two-component system sensor histidine kinase UhpB
LAKAQQMAQLGNWEWEIATGETQWSDEVYHIFGVDSDTPATLEIFLSRVHPEDRELVEKSLTAALVREVNFNVDVRVFPAGSEVRFIHAEAEVEFDGEGKALRMFGTVQDITERKEIEQEIRASREQLRQLSSHLQAVREEEKATIAREIHDELGGNLTALKMDISWLARKLPPEMEAALEKTGSMANLVDTSVHAMRRIVTELRPTVLDDLGLLAAMSWQASEFTKRYGIQCTVAMHGEEIVVGDAYRIALFRIFQESLTNAARYSKAGLVLVDVWREHDNIAMDIVDNGIGLPEDKAMDPTSHGLRGMMERARTLGGTVEIGSAPGEGVAISVRIPLPVEDEIAI